MSPRPDRAAFDAWLVAHPGASDAAARRAFPGLPATTRRRWHAQGGRPPPASAQRPPATELRPDARTSIEATTRDLLAGLRAGAAEFARRAAAGEPFDRDAAQALLNAQRTLAGLVESFPGLLELVEAPEADERSDERIDALRAAMGLDQTPDPAHAAEGDDR